ncbi:hypothetical protein SLA2020_225620 [Shorea laevis]
MRGKRMQESEHRNRSLPGTDGGAPERTEPIVCKRRPRRRCLGMANSGSGDGELVGADWVKMLRLTQTWFVFIEGPSIPDSKL